MVQPTTHPWTVLIVDDSEYVRQLLRLYVEAEGYVVEEAADGLKAFARLRHRATRYLVLLDYAMPELDGWGVLRLATADPRLLSQHAYIVMSAQAALPDAFEQFPIDQAIPRTVKPIARRDLLTLLTQAEARLGHLAATSVAQFLKPS